MLADESLQTIVQMQANCVPQNKACIFIAVDMANFHHVMASFSCSSATKAPPSPWKGTFSHLYHHLK
jgi:hypothetical protein